MVRIIREARPRVKITIKARLRPLRPRGPRLGFGATLREEREARMPKPKAWMAWSTGKDGAWALHTALTRDRGEVEITGLLATVTDPYERVSMHGVREELLFAQAKAVGLPVHVVRIPAECSNELYREKMRAAMLEAKAQGVTEVAFGDLFLEGIREYREKHLAEVGMTARFPLWGRDTRELADEMISGGLRANITCLDPRVVPRHLAGHAFDEELLAALPEGVDPCGERGEFHTFVRAAPVFSCPLDVEIGETVERGGFVFTDVTPRSRPS
jgi:uncharacterized protein (TIGR00290 family)